MHEEYTIRARRVETTQTPDGVAHRKDVWPCAICPTTIVSRTSYLECKLHAYRHVRGQKCTCICQKFLRGSLVWGMGKR